MKLRRTVPLRVPSAVPVVPSAAPVVPSAAPVVPSAAPVVLGAALVVLSAALGCKSGSLEAADDSDTSGQSSPAVDHGSSRDGGAPKNNAGAAGGGEPDAKGGASGDADDTAGGEMPSDEAGVTPDDDPPTQPDDNKPDDNTPGGSPTTDGTDIACPEYAFFCDGFEGDEVDVAQWDILDYWARNRGKEADTQSDHFVIDDQNAIEGKSSLLLQWGGEYGSEPPTTIQLKEPLPAPDDEIYVRFYMRLQDFTFPGAHPYFLTTVGGGDQWDPYGDQVAFGTIHGELSTNAFSRGLDRGLQWFEARDSLSAGKWFCVQIRAFGDHQDDADTSHPNEEYSVAIDGVEIPALLGNDTTWKSDAPEHWSPFYDGSFWRLGFGSAPSNDDPLQYWLDALAFAHQPIPCLAASP